MMFAPNTTQPITVTPQQCLHTRISLRVRTLLSMQRNVLKKSLECKTTYKETHTHTEAHTDVEKTCRATLKFSDANEHEMLAGCDGCC